MREAVVTRFGDPDVIETRTRPTPEPSSGEVVVDVHAVDTLFLETMVRSGKAQQFFPMRPPYVPGNAVAGVVAGLGRVVTRTGGKGGYADQVVVNADALVPIPDGVSFETAAALAHDAVTALRLFDVAAVKPDDTVVVLGASGGLGILLVQLALARAAGVVAVARGPKLARVRQLRPTTSVDSEAPDWLAQARAALPAAGADVMFDNIGGVLGAAAVDLVAPGGRFSGHGTPSGRFTTVDPAEAQRRDITVTGIADVQLADAEVQRYTQLALAAAADGTLAPVIGQTFSLERAADAHRAIEARTVFGKTLLLAHSVVT